MKGRRSNSGGHFSLYRFLKFPTSHLQNDGPLSEQSGVFFIISLVYNISNHTNNAAKPKSHSGNTTIIDKIVALVYSFCLWVIRLNNQLNTLSKSEIRPAKHQRYVAVGVGKAVELGVVAELARLDESSRYFRELAYGSLFRR